jgi:hypothetical protein
MNDIENWIDENIDHLFINYQGSIKRAVKNGGKSSILNEKEDLRMSTKVRVRRSSTFDGIGGRPTAN